MQHTLVLDQPAPGSQLAQAGLGCLVVADHPSPVVDRDEQRPAVEVAGTGDGVDLESGPRRVGHVDGVAVVHDAFEDGERSYPHPVDEFARSLADAIEHAVPGWAARVLEPHGVDAAPVATAMLRDLMPALTAAQANPLHLLRSVAVPHLTAALRDAGVPPVARDEFSIERFPDDVYDLSPATWSDVDESLVDPGIAWGAAKAFAHKQAHS